MAQHNSNGICTPLLNRNHLIISYLLKLYCFIFLNKLLLITEQCACYWPCSLCINLEHTNMSIVACIEHTPEMARTSLLGLKFYTRQTSIHSDCPFNKCFVTTSVVFFQGQSSFKSTHYRDTENEQSRYTDILQAISGDLMSDTPTQMT